jgi:hypothetical protein
MAAKSGAFRPSREDKPKRNSPGVAPAETTPANLNRLIHERTRLAIISALAVNNSLAFNELKDLLRVTDGNLSVHARKLERRPWLDFDWMGGRNGVVSEGKGVIEIMIGLAAN